jgi:hypothetical protein
MLCGYTCRLGVRPPDPDGAAVAPGPGIPVEIGRC